MASQFEDTDSAAESTLLQESRDQLTSEREALARFRELSSLSAPQLADTELSQANKPNPYLDEMMRQEKTAFQQQQEAAKAKQDAIAARNRAMIPAYDEYERALRGDIANPPQQPPPPVIPRAPTRDQYIDSTVAKSMFAVASMIAGLAIGGGRGRGMLAMAGMRGALQGLNEKNAQKYKDGIEEYKENVDAQIQEYNALYRQYLDQVQAKNLGLAERYRLVELTALRNNDPITAATAAENDADKLFKHLDDYGKMITQMEKATQGDMLAPLKLKMQELGLEKSKLGLEKAQVDLEKARQPKPLTAAQQKQQDQLVGTSNVLREIEELIPEMEKKGFLPKSEGRVATEAASLRRWYNSSDPTLVKWRSLQGAIVGFDRSVFNDIGARVKAAYEGSLALFDNPGTAQGVRDAIGTYRNILEQSPEAKRVLSANPEALTGYTPYGGGGQSADMVKDALPPGGTLMKGKILVRRKSDGKISPLSEKYFDPAIYEKLPEGVPYQPGVGPARVSRGFEY